MKYELEGPDNLEDLWQQELHRLEINDTVCAERPDMPFQAAILYMRDGTRSLFANMPSGNLTLSFLHTAVSKIDNACGYVARNHYQRVNGTLIDRADYLLENGQVHRFMYR